MKIILRGAAAAVALGLLLSLLVPSISQRTKHLEARCFDTLGWSLLGTPLEHSTVVRRAMADYLGLNFYRDANAALPAYVPHRVVFLGDSMIGIWAGLYPQTFFPGRGYLGRGIASQTTASLRWRFPSDVLALHPETMVLLVGINDLLMGDAARPRQTRGNYEYLVQQSKQNHIRVVLCSVLPVTGDLRSLTPGIRSTNAWLQQLAMREEVPYVDFYSALASPNGDYLPGLSDDRLHPNAAGYALMEQVALRTLNATAPN